MEFSADQLNEFHRRGILKLRQLIPGDVASEVRHHLDKILEREGATQNRRWVRDKITSPEAFKDFSAIQKQLKKSCKTVMKRFDLEEILTLSEQLAGITLSNLGQIPQLLFTPPNADVWSLPSKIWHVDAPRLGDSACPGIQIFSFVDEVLPGGGGTIVAAGSHRYVNDQGLVKSKDVKYALTKAHPWFAGLFSPDGEEQAVYMDKITWDGDIELQAVELTGSPGDVYFMDLRVFHSLAPNILDRPRLMVTQRYFGDELAGVFK